MVSYYRNTIPRTACISKLMHSTFPPDSQFWVRNESNQVKTFKLQTQPWMVERIQFPSDLPNSKIKLVRAHGRAPLHPIKHSDSSLPTLDPRNERLSARRAFTSGRLKYALISFKPIVNLPIGHKSSHSWSGGFCTPSQLLRHSHRSID